MNDPPTQPPSDASTSAHPTLMELSVPTHHYDAWVMAGGRLFRAHQSVLAAHSPYLRAASATMAFDQDGETRLLLPHVPAQGFAAILAYMYTGRLPVTPSTLYEVLLAGHLLQMPSVIGTCDAMIASLDPSMSLWRNANLPHVATPLHMWRSLATLVPPPPTQMTHTPSQITHTPTLVRPTPTRPQPTIMKIISKSNDNEERKCTSDAYQRMCDRAQHSDDDAVVDEDDDDEEDDDHEVDIEMESSCDGRERNSSSANTLSQEEHLTGVIIDIAACDGPVFFERVVNKAFCSEDGGNASDGDTDIEDAEINVDEIDSGDDRSCVAGPSGIGGSSNKSYHCVYCNNTFKSHYCYQKHMRRHINPITVEVDQLNNNNVNEESPMDEPPPTCSILSNKHSLLLQQRLIKGTATTSAAAQRSAMQTAIEEKSSGKVLDLNVQYFPCKTCGSKFPSYYFVHKHRRMCHQEEEPNDKDTHSEKDLK